MRSRWSLALAAGIAAMIAAGWVWVFVVGPWWVEDVSARLPALPDLHDKNDLLRQKLLAADRAARCSARPHREIGELGNFYHANHFYAEAAQCYQLAMSLDPSQPRWPYYLAVVCEMLGINEGVDNLLRRVLALAGDYTPAVLKLADVEFKQQRMAEAQAGYERCLAQSEDHPFAHVGLARIAIARSDWPAARRHLEQAIARDPRFALAHRQLATVFDRLGQPAEAAAARARADQWGRTRYPPDPWVEDLLDWCYDPAYLLAHELTAYYNPARRGTWRLSVLERIVACDPRSAQGRLNLAVALAEAGRRREAREHLERALALDPDLDAAHCELGVTLASEGRIDAAEQQFREALRINPSCAEALAYLGSLYAGRGDHRRAAPLFRQAIDRHDALNLETVRAYVASLMVGGEADAARAFLHELLGRHPTAGDLWCCLADTHAAAGDFAGAVEVLREGLGRSPYDTRMAEQLSWLLATSPVASPGTAAEAVAMAKLAREFTAPDEPTWRAGRTLAAAYAHAGRFEEATAVARDAADDARRVGEDAAAAEIADQMRRHAAHEPWRWPVVPPARGDRAP